MMTVSDNDDLNIGEVQGRREEGLVCRALTSVEGYKKLVELHKLFSV